MIYKSGKLVAIDSVKTNSATISGDGLPSGRPLGVNTSAVIDPLKTDISTVSAGLDTVSGTVMDISGAVEAVSGAVDTVSGAIGDISAGLEAVSAGLGEISGAVDAVSGTVDAVSAAVSGVSAAVDGALEDIGFISATLDDVAGALEEEIEIRGEEVDYLSAAISAKQDALSAGDNIAIEDNTVSVSGTKDIRLHWPLFARETPDGLHIGVHDTTRRFEAEFESNDPENPISGAFSAAGGYRVKNNTLTVDPNIRNFTMCVSYEPGLKYRPDFVPETVFTVTDRDGSTVATDRRPLAYPQTCTFATCLENRSPYTFAVSGDISALSGIKIKLTCAGQYVPDYGYLDELEDAYSGTGAQILVWNPEVLGVGDGDIVGINNDTALGV